MSIAHPLFLRHTQKQCFVNVDNPEEFIETTVFSEGIDTQDKGSGKAMTYGDKYALMKMYKISTGDDPDAVASPDPDAPTGTGEAPKPAKTWGGAKTTTPTPAKKENSAPAAWGTPPAQQSEQKQSGWGNGWKKSS